MTSPISARLVTAAELAELPEPGPGGKVELVAGRIVEHSPVGGEHSQLALLVGSILFPFVRAHRLGSVGVECGFELAYDPDVVLAPDAHFVAIERIPGGLMPIGYFAGAPDLAIEVMSPNDREQEVVEKVDAYLRAGTQRVWVVRPAVRSVTVYRPDGTAQVVHVGGTLTSDDAAFAVDGFALPLADLFV